MLRSSEERNKRSITLWHELAKWEGKENSYILIICLALCPDKSEGGRICVNH